MKNSENITHTAIRQLVRPLPYFYTADDASDRQLATSLRKEFRSKVSRRLPGHHLRGWEHWFIVRWVADNRRNWPCFLRVDIEKFFPNIDRVKLVVGVQIAYRELLGLKFVPDSFKNRYVGALHSWCGSLPLTRGIPIGSSLSGIAAPLMLLPLWLELKRRYGVPFLVFMDDLLILGRTPDQVASVYAFLEETLWRDYGLRLNLNKTLSGRFADGRFDFCGWSFAGGYARISPKKEEAFLRRLKTEDALSGRKTLKAYLRLVNRHVDGFANYYKHGDVIKQFQALDAKIRKIVRMRLSRDTGGYVGNAALQRLGLHSLESSYRNLHLRHQKPVGTKRIGVSSPIKEEARQARAQMRMTGSEMLLQLERQTEILDKVSNKLTQLLTMQRKLLKAVDQLGEL